MVASLAGLLYRSGRRGGWSWGAACGWLRRWHSLPGRQGRSCWPGCLSGFWACEQPVCCAAGMRLAEALALIAGDAGKELLAGLP